MAWEWQYNSNPRRWTLTVGEWRATVERVAGAVYLWHAYVERAVAPHERHDGPRHKDPMDGRTWCLTKIAELRTHPAP